MASYAWRAGRPVLKASCTGLIVAADRPRANTVMGSPRLTGRSREGQGRFASDALKVPMVSNGRKAVFSTMGICRAEVRERCRRASQQTKAHG
jgi:hypothetical protein